MAADSTELPGPVCPPVLLSSPFLQDNIIHTSINDMPIDFSIRNVTSNHDLSSVFFSPVINEINNSIMASNDHTRFQIPPPPSYQHYSVFHPSTSISMTNNDLVDSLTVPLCDNNGSVSSVRALISDKSLAVINLNKQLSSNESVSSVSHRQYMPMSILSSKYSISRGVCSCPMCLLSIPSTKLLTDHLNICHPLPTVEGFVSDCGTHSFCNGCNRWLTKNQRSGVIRHHTCNDVAVAYSSSKRAKLSHISDTTTLPSTFMREDMITGGPSVAPQSQSPLIHDGLYDVRDNQDILVQQIHSRKRKLCMEEEGLFNPSSLLDLSLPIVTNLYSDINIPMCTDSLAVGAYPSVMTTQSMPDPLCNDSVMCISTPVLTSSYPVTSSDFTSTPRSRPSSLSTNELSSSILSAPDCFNATVSIDPPISGSASHVVESFLKSPLQLPLSGDMSNSSLVACPLSFFGVTNPCVTVSSQSTESIPNTCSLSDTCPRLLSASPIESAHIPLGDSIGNTSSLYINNNDITLDTGDESLLHTQFLTYPSANCDVPRDAFTNCSSAFSSTSDIVAMLPSAIETICSAASSSVVSLGASINCLAASPSVCDTVVPVPSVVSSGLPSQLSSNRLRVASHLVVLPINTHASPTSASSILSNFVRANPSLTVRPPSVFGVTNPCITVVSQSINTTPNAGLLSVVSPRLLSISPVALVRSSIEELTDTTVSYITPEFRVESLSLTQVDDLSSSPCPALPLVCSTVGTAQTVSSDFSSHVISRGALTNCLTASPSVVSLDSPSVCDIVVPVSSGLSSGLPSQFLSTRHRVASRLVVLPVTTQCELVADSKPTPTLSIMSNIVGLVDVSVSPSTVADINSASNGSTVVSLSPICDDYCSSSLSILDGYIDTMSFESLRINVLPRIPSFSPDMLYREAISMDKFPIRLVDNIDDNLLYLPLSSQIAIARKNMRDLEVASALKKGGIHCGNLVAIFELKYVGDHQRPLVQVLLSVSYIHLDTLEILNRANSGVGAPVALAPGLAKHLTTAELLTCEQSALHLNSLSARNLLNLQVSFDVTGIDLLYFLTRGYWWQDNICRAVVMSQTPSFRPGYFYADPCYSDSRWSFLSSKMTSAVANEEFEQAGRLSDLFFIRAQILYCVSG